MAGSELGLAKLIYDGFFLSFLFGILLDFHFVATVNEWLRDGGCAWFEARVVFLGGF